ncbi:universal stress protein [Nocardia beijingensis]|uniref:universal stress protein n=1 Tax=Nocardia beijingensis TaxID=95162 RepID=UPI001895BC8F|nr:universal stress protein [Nocardia beijingensis]MBF6468241.1 universal stress protein [Nocardia beijingensis]
MTENTTAPCEQIGRSTVVAVDGSAFSYHAVAWAAADAALYRRGLHIVTSVRTGFGPGPRSTDTAAGRRHNGERILTEARDIARKAAPDETLTVETELIDDPIVAYLIDRSRRSRMVVVGHRGLGAFSRRLPGSVSTAVIKNAHCPTAVVRSAPATDAESASKPVLVGVDGTRNCGSAVRLAFEEASRREVELIALHAWSDTRGTNLIPAWEAVRELEDAALAENLAGFGERYPEVPVRRVLAHDSPVRCLTDEACSAQLLVVGSRGRRGATGLLPCSITSALVNSVGCPIIVAREPRDQG